MHISSLPSKYGIGAFSKSAYDFCDWLAESGQSYWQILPLGVTGYGDSPYQSFSTYAGNPYFISLEELIEWGLLKKEECDELDFGKDLTRVDYHKLYQNRYPLLYKAYKRFDLSNSPEYKSFVEENSYWLLDYSLFMAIKNNNSDSSWLLWDERLKNKNPHIIEQYRDKLSFEIDFHNFLQFLFFSQWKKLKNYMATKNIKVIGDIPIYVSLDSADVWNHPHLFQLDKNKLPLSVAGCPPDEFSKKGQLWGNPLYNWEEHKRENYTWWKKRFLFALSLYDVVRIDHFRGFDQYYSIPYNSADAIHGEWKNAPGKELFNTLGLDKERIIAEDLGFVTPSLKKLLKDTEFRGMKIVQFAFDSRDTGFKNDYMPHNYPEKCVVYTGTHDNSTTTSWFSTLPYDDKRLAREYIADFFTPAEIIYKSFISLAMQSPAELSIIPMQDWLGLNDSARMNTPSTSKDNWQWRIKKNSLTKELSQAIKKKTSLYGRL